MVHKWHIYCQLGDYISPTTLGEPETTIEHSWERSHVPQPRACLSRWLPSLKLTAKAPEHRPKPNRKVSTKIPEKKRPPLKIHLGLRETWIAAFHVKLGSSSRLIFEVRFKGAPRLIFTYIYYQSNLQASRPVLWILWGIGFLHICEVLTTYSIGH